MVNIMDKINEAIGLAKRIQNEMKSGNYDNALYLTDTFIFLFSGHQAATHELITSYTAVSQKLQNEGQLEQAEALISKGLTVDPQNSQLLSILVKVKKGQHQLLKKLGRRPVATVAHEFIEKYFPKELPLFDLAWRVFKDIRPEDFTQEALSGALGIVGKDQSELNTPKVIVLLNQVSGEDIESLSDEKAKEAVTNIGRAIGCSQKLIDKVTGFILRR